MFASWRAIRAIPTRLFSRQLAFPRASVPLNRVSSRQRHRTIASSEVDDVSPELGADFFGTYSIILPPEPFVFGVSHVPQRPVPPHIVRPPYVTPADDQSNGLSGDGRIQLGSCEERKLRQAARLAQRVLDHAGTLVKVGTTTDQLDAAIHEYIVTHSAYPSPLGYSGFPKACCTSVNNIMVHGIPDDRRLDDGDILNIDVTVYLNGYHGDTSRMFLVGNVDEAGRDLIAVTDMALEAGIAVCGPGQPFKSIGRAIHELADFRGYSVSSQFTGHGIGEVFHRSPWILHHRNDEPGLMLPGQCFTIEPCLVQGTNPRSWIFPDGWTASTENCARSAQKEHMVLITEHGAEVITRD
ncbi:methionyl aminopeptidase [Multifurca ochricompacta]|uniref:Methionine aminopeptidase n=1 Tax=Multifurca ochricompacta TaxID=376703 RepID=A0AAD4QSC3_9AGAM|nr:methionyl aminopeptidase [Multifurca ochricompacta]